MHVLLSGRSYHPESFVPLCRTLPMAENVVRLQAFCLYLKFGFAIRS